MESRDTPSYAIEFVVLAMALVLLYVVALTPVRAAFDEEDDVPPPVYVMLAVIDQTLVEPSL